MNITDVSVAAINSADNITISGNYKISGDNILDAKAGELWELDCIFILGICLIKCTNWGIL